MSSQTTNPNNCSTCDYTYESSEEKGHCYMWRETPTFVCKEHTEIKKLDRQALAAMSLISSLISR